ncbi:SDR family oxidoreductase [bacterium]|nr:SDR family oxidoreductase [candidate division CSSED10-310 bacterium]
MSTYLVTGAAGFIGSNLVRGLLDRGESVRGIDNFATGRKSNLAGLLPRMRFREGDIRDRRDLEAIMPGVDFVLHQAAIPSVPRSVADPMLSNDNNITGTLQVLLAARDFEVRRVVTASSSSVYGDTEVLPKSEHLPLNPLSPYALAKLTGEHYCRLFSNLYGLDTICLRYFNVFGPYQDPASHYAAAIPKFIRRLRQGMEPEIYGDGEQTRDFTYIANVVEANILASCVETPGHHVCNIGCGERITVNRLVDCLRALLGVATPARHLPPRPGDVRHSLADISRARELLGYEPKVRLEEALHATVSWFLSRE